MIAIGLSPPVRGCRFGLIRSLTFKSITMKKFIYLAVWLTGLSAAATTPPEVSEKVLKAFKETFANASNVVWTEMENNFKATFLLSEIRARAIYDNDGNLLQTVRYYDGKYLPPNIVASLKKRYGGKEIFGVTEISSENDMAYHVTLKDEKNWYVVKADPFGNLEQTKKFKDAGL
jgi:hypothetical protein